VGDVNGEFPDIVITDFAGSAVLLYLSQYDPSAPERWDPTNPQNDLAHLFAPPIFLEGGRSALGTLILDVNGDGKNDLLVTSNESTRSTCSSRDEAVR
jgi:hypothetical protein